MIARIASNECSDIRLHHEASSLSCLREYSARRPVPDTRGLGVSQFVPAVVLRGKDEEATRMTYPCGLLSTIEGGEDVILRGAGRSDGFGYAPLDLGNSGPRRLADCQTGQCDDNGTEPDCRSRFHGRSDHEQELVDLHRDRFLLRFLRLRHSDFQHAVFEGGFDLITLHVAGQSDGP